jgi:hypothetical protein
VELIFAVSLGAVTRVHRRQAIVAHVSSNGTGLRMKGMTQARRFTPPERVSAP